jgi:hypothetical protein
MDSEIPMVEPIEFEPVTRSVRAAFQRGEAVKELPKLTIFDL